MPLTLKALVNVFLVLIRLYVEIKKPYEIPKLVRQVGYYKM